MHKGANDPQSGVIALNDTDGTSMRVRSFKSGGIYGRETRISGRIHLSQVVDLKGGFVRVDEIASTRDQKRAAK